ncbi:radical SAM protein [Nannocystaceae bacterium ST9]
MSARAIVRLTHDCDNACVFCGQRGLSGSLPFAREDLVALRERFDEVSFVGGEPSLDARLASAIAAARELGFTAIGLQTNARALAHADLRLAELHAAGLGDLQLSIHAPSAAEHDYHTGRPGSFAAAIDLLERARRRGLICVVASVVTRSNFRELPRMPALLKRHGVSAWLIEWVRPFGRAGESFARVVPRFGMALPWALAALEQARRVDLSAWIRGAAICTLGRFAGQALADAPRSYPAACEGCVARSRCVGVDARYLDHFGAGELDARRAAVDAAATRSPDAGRLRLQRMFVGVGELVEPASELAERGLAGKIDGKIDGKHRRLPVLAEVVAPRAESEPHEPT